MEAAAFLAEPVLGGNATAVEMELRRVGGAPAVLVERAADLEARRALLNEEHGHRAARRTCPVGLGGDAVEIAVDAVGDEHLGAVDHVAVAVAPRESADAFHIGAGIRLGHRHRGNNLAGNDARHPFVLLRFAPGLEDMHRGHVGVIEDRVGDAGKRRTAELFGEHDAGERVHLRSAVARRVADAEKAQAAHAAQHLARHVTLLFPGQRLRLDLGLDEPAHLRAEHLMLRREVWRTQIGKRPAVSGPCIGNSVHGGWRLPSRWRRWQRDWREYSRVSAS